LHLTEPEMAAENKARVTARLARVTVRNAVKQRMPERAMTHRDYLLREMAWMAVDFANERKRHVQGARKVARAIEQYFKTFELRKKNKEVYRVRALLSY